MNDRQHTTVVVLVVVVNIFGPILIKMYCADMVV
jgi:hypothetical protein